MSNRAILHITPTAAALHATLADTRQLIGALDLRVTQLTDACERAGLGGGHVALRTLLLLAESVSGAPIQADVAEALTINRTSAMHLVDAAEAEGLVRRERAPGDRRAHVIVPTDEGRRRLALALAHLG